MSNGAAFNSKLATLTTDRHDRDVLGFRYVYPVVSRRARGVSIGINLNYNNACNWRCIYCQVEGLVRGSAPNVDLAELERELTTFARIAGDFLQQHVPVEHRRLSDIAFSGNGEPTSCPQFGEVVELVGQIRGRQPLLGALPVVLISNGSLAGRESVQTALGRLAQIGGRVWFKLDGGSDAALRRINSTSTRLARHLARLEIVARLCPTYIQSCWFRTAGGDPDPNEISDFLAMLRDLKAREIPVLGIQLYTLARESHQPESRELAPVTASWLDAMAAAISHIGLDVQVA